jgi:glucose-1-phosphate thymidylyltransferase
MAPSASEAHPFQEETFMSGYRALLLCAGYGTRMGDAASGPKPLIEVGGRPMLDYLLERIQPLTTIEHVDVVTNARYAAAFQAWAESRARLFGRPITVHEDGTDSPETRLGAVGDLELLLRRIDPAPAGALVAAGDNIFLFELDPLWAAFLRRGRCHVLALEESNREALRRTGVLEIDPEGRVHAIAEKPEEPQSKWACPSLYALTAEALARVPEYLAAGHPRDEIGRFVAHLAKVEEVYAVPSSGRRFHVGNPRELEQAERVLGGDGGGDRGGA